MSERYSVTVDVGVPVYVSQCPPGFCVYCGKLAYRTNDGMLFTQDGGVEQRIYPEPRVWPARIVSAKKAVKK